MSALIVHIRTFPAPTVVTVAGEIDLVTAPQLRERLLPLPADDLVLDLSQVRLLAAAGLRALLELQDSRTAAGAQLVLAAASAPVRRVLWVTGHDKTLPATASVEEAIAYVTAAATQDNPDGPRTGTDGHDPTFPLAPPRPPGGACRAHQGRMARHERTPGHGSARLDQALTTALEERKRTPRRQAQVSPTAPGRRGRPPGMNSRCVGTPLLWTHPLRRLQEGDGEPSHRTNPAACG